MPPELGSERYNHTKNMVGNNPHSHDNSDNGFISITSHLFTEDHTEFSLNVSNYTDFSNVLTTTDFALSTDIFDSVDQMSLTELLQLADLLCQLRKRSGYTPKFCEMGKDFHVLEESFKRINDIFSYVIHVVIILGLIGNLTAIVVLKRDVFSGSTKIYFLLLTSK